MNTVATQPETSLSPVNAMLAEPHEAVTPLDLPTEVFKNALARRKTNRAALLEWIKSALVENSDYGRIHAVTRSKCPLAAQGRAHECANPAHWSKPSLWKPGAEKIAGMLGVTVHYPALRRYEQAAIDGRDLSVLILRCELQDAAGRVVATGVGARRVAVDDGDINKALKMAAKSAHIDATLRMAGLSEVFTQDLEDDPNATTATDGHAETGSVHPPAAAASGAPTDAPNATLPAVPASTPAADNQVADRPAAGVPSPPASSSSPAPPPAAAVTGSPAATGVGKPIPASVQRQLEQLARVKGVPAPAVQDLAQAKAALQRLFTLPAAPTAAG